MAGDWIKMRPTLLSSPKVNGIARMLETDTKVTNALSTGYSGLMNEVVNRNVMRSVTVTSLLMVWGAANEHTEDGVFKNADLSDIDDIAGIPNFGLAMESVGWLIFDESKETVTLPNFNEYNTCGKDRQKELNRKRQQRYRDKHNAKSNVTNNVTNNDREEKRREDIKENNKRKKLIPNDFKLSDTLIEYAKKKDITDLTYLENFTEDFITSCKQHGYKYADFDSAWKNWLRSRIEKGDIPNESDSQSVFKLAVAKAKELNLEPFKGAPDETPDQFIERVNNAA